MPFIIEQHESENIANISLLGALDHLTKTAPTKTWVYTPKSADLKNGWREISYSEVSYAVNGLSGWIKDNVKVASTGEVIAYMGDNDVRYIIVMLSLMRLGLKTMLPSPRNSPEGQSNLFKLTKSSTLLYSESFDISSTQDSVSNLRTYQIPSFDELVQSGKERETVVSQASLEDDETVLVMHTSGSTGLPKPIRLTNGFLRVLSDLKNMKAPAGRQHMWELYALSGKPMFTMMPFFHMAGLTTTASSFFDSRPMIVTPTGRPINSEVVIEILHQTKPYTAMFAPSVLEDISNTPEGLDALHELEFLVWSGAPLAHDAGERIRKNTRLSPLIGATEVGLLPTLIPEAVEDWNYYEWSPESGIDMEPDSDGLYECVIKPNPDRRFQGVFYTFPDIKEWRTKDLYAKHPSKPNLWEYRGRKDDVLVLSNGEKVQPVTFEKAIEDHALVKGAMVVGQGRFQTSLLIEPDWPHLDASSTDEDFIKMLWPTIEHANEDLPAHGRVWKTKVAITKRDKPFVRAGKGSIMRRATVKLFEPEIEAIYSDDGFDDQLGKLDQDADADTVKSFVLQAVKLVMPDFPEDASDDADFFSSGFDSLQVLGLSNALSHACEGVDKATIAGKDIYANPSIDALSNYILRARGQTEALNGPKREDVIIQMLDKYTHDLPERFNSQTTQAPKSHTVILTGSTGGLGNYILQELIALPTVSHIYCLNRSADAGDRQKRSFESRNAPFDFSKVTFLQTDFSREHFGLAHNVYTTLCETTTLFIHNAWTVDFNKALTSYEQTHVAGVRRVVDFSLASTHNAAISFISSIATVENWTALHSNTSQVPEQTFSDPAVTVPQGYSESKYIAEHILRIASSRCGIQTTIIRAGQLAGPSTKEGIWNPNEWVPSIASTSKAMGLIPATLGTLDTVDWVPLNNAARIVTDLVFGRASDSAQNQETFHLINPRVTRWSSLTPIMQANFPGSRIVPFTEWVDALAQVPTTREEIEKKPGVKLLDFYRGLSSESGALPSLETTKTEGRSVAMRGLEGVSGALMENWLRQWRLLME